MPKARPTQDLIKVQISNLTTRHHDQSLHRVLHVYMDLRIWILRRSQYESEKGIVTNILAGSRKVSFILIASPPYITISKTSD